MSGLEVAAAGMGGLVAKATAVLCLALGLAWLARRGSARTLHLLWTTTFGVLLALPALSLLGPSWSVPVLPVRDVEVEAVGLPTGKTAGRASAGTPREMPGSSSSPGSPRQNARSRSAPGSSLVESGPSRPGASDRPAPLTLSAMALFIWALGCGAALTSLVVGGFRFRKLVREAVPVGDPDWLRQADSIRRRARLRSEVRFVLSARASTPMTGGLWRPVILLPSSAGNWTPERREVVLAHELVHVRRHDALRHLLGRVAAALYWFHPLGWLASRLSTVASERSCDEEVLALGTRPSEYARHLFSLAAEPAGGPPALALRMVQRSQLENRIMSILKQHRPRYCPARTSATLAVLGATGLLIACANPVPRDPDAQPSPGVEKTVLSDAPAPDRVIRPPSPEPTPAASLMPQPEPPEDAVTRPVATAPAMPDPSPESTTVSDLPLEPASEPGPAPAPPEFAQDAGRQAFECSLGNRITTLRRRDEWTLQRRVDGMRLCMRNHGNVEMVSGRAAAGSMDDGSWLVLESEAQRLHRLVITPGPGGLEYDWSIDGRPEDFEEEAEEWRDLMLTVMAGYLDVQGIRGEEAILRGEISTHRGHVSTLRGKISTHRGHISSLRGVVATHRGHISSLRGQIMSQRGQVANITSQLSAQVDLIVNQHAMTTLADRMREAVDKAGQAWATARLRETLESARESLQRVDVQEAIEAARQALGTDDMAETLKAAAEALETPEMQETMAGLAELSETFAAAADDWTTLADDLQQIERNLAARQAELEQEVAVLARARMRETEEEIEEYDLDGRVADIERQIEEYDLDGKVSEIEAQIEQYDLDGRIREIEAQIEELDADRRAAQIERSIQDDIAALRQLIG